MILTPDQQRVKTLLAETITLLCKNGLSFKSEFSIEALVGITLDNSDVFLLSIKETIRNNLPPLVVEKSVSNQTTQEHDSNQCEEVSERSVENLGWTKKGRNSEHPETPKDNSSEAFSIRLNDQVTSINLDVPPMVIASSEDENDSNSFIPPSTFSESESFLADGQFNSLVKRRRKKLKTQNISFEDIAATATRAQGDSMEETGRSYENDSISDSYQQNNDSLTAASHHGRRGLKGEQFDYDTFSDFSEPAKTSQSYPTEMKIKQETSNEDGNNESCYYNYSLTVDASTNQSFPSSSNNFLYQDDQLAGCGDSSSFRSQQSVVIPSSLRRERKRASTSNQQTKLLQQGNTATHSKTHPFNDHSPLVPYRSSERGPLSNGTLETGVIRCRECEEVFPVIEAYLQHLTVHRRVLTGCGEDEAKQFYKYPCPCCEKSFSSHTNFRGHWSKHTGIKEFVCRFCGVEYTYKQMLKDHILQRHQMQLTLDDAGIVEQYK